MDYFRNNCIIFTYFFSFNSGIKFNLQIIYNVLDFFFFKDNLYDLSLLRPIFKFSKFFFCVFSIIANNDH